MHDIAVHHGVSDQYFADDAKQQKTFNPTVDGMEQRIAYAAFSNCRWGKAMDVSESDEIQWKQDWCNPRTWKAYAPWTSITV